MKKLFSTYLFSFLAFFLLATIAPVIGSNDALADRTSCSTQAITLATGSGSTFDDAVQANRDLCETHSVYTGQGTGVCYLISNGSECDWNNTTIGNQNENAFVDTLCNVLKIVTGNGGKAFAAFAIISLGIGFFTGKVSWGLMIGVAAGIAAMFGAPTIVAAISGKGAFTCNVESGTGAL